jgi:hypothetical protein
MPNPSTTATARATNVNIRLSGIFIFLFYTSATVSPLIDLTSSSKISEIVLMIDLLIYSKLTILVKEMKNVHSLIYSTRNGILKNILKLEV